MPSESLFSSVAQECQPEQIGWHQITCVIWLKPALGVCADPRVPQSPWKYEWKWKEKNIYMWTNWHNDNENDKNEKGKRWRNLGTLPILLITSSGISALLKVTWTSTFIFVSFQQIFWVPLHVICSNLPKPRPRQDWVWNSQQHQPQTIWWSDLHRPCSRSARCCLMQMKFKISWFQQNERDRDHVPPHLAVGQPGGHLQLQLQLHWLFFDPP